MDLKKKYNNGIFISTQLPNLYIDVQDNMRSLTTY